MSDNGRRYAPKDATPRSQNSREFKLNLSEDQLNHTDELEDLQGYAGSRAPQRVEESSAGARSARAERSISKVRYKTDNCKWEAQDTSGHTTLLCSPAFRRIADVF